MEDATKVSQSMYLQLDCIDNFSIVLGVSREVLQTQAKRTRYISRMRYTCTNGKRLYYQYTMEFPGLGEQIHVVYAMNDIILSSGVTSSIDYNQW